MNKSNILIDIEVIKNDSSLLLKCLVKYIEQISAKFSTPKPAKVLLSMISKNEKDFFDLFLFSHLIDAHLYDNTTLYLSLNELTYYINNCDSVIETFKNLTALQILIDNKGVFHPFQHFIYNYDEEDNPCFQLNINKEFLTACLDVNNNTFNF